jgi:hypothetical protein
MEDSKPGSSFLVNVDQIKKELKAAAVKLRDIAQKDPAKRKEADREITILKKCFDDLGNLEWI